MESQYKETFNTWNKIADLYEEIFMDLELYNDSYEVFCNNLPKSNLAVLELGCGPGNITKHLLSNDNSLNILATDVAENMLLLAKKNNSSISTQILDVRNLNQLNQQFKGIMVGFVLPYLSATDCTKLITDSQSLLCKNGLLYLSFVEGSPNDSGFISGSTGDRAYFYYHQLSAIQKDLTANGFEVMDTILVPYTKKDGKTEKHTILISKKID
jgi:ubiquinone/menaquinone biosynthesis C-methylase UbiE